MDETASSRRTFLLCLGAVVALLCAAAAVRWNDWTYGSDTGTFAQIVANSFHGFTDGIEGGTHFRFHFSPILALLWPFVAATRTPLVLQFIQVALIALVPVLVAGLLHPYAGSPWAERCGLLVLLYPPLLAGAFSEFHELAFYPVLLIALVLAADRARWLWFTVIALAIVLVREDASLDLIVIGSVLAIMGGLRRGTSERGLLLGEPQEPERLLVFGMGLAGLAASTLALYAFVIVPRAGGWNPSHFYEYPFAHGPLQTALAVFTHPVEIARATGTLGRLTYLAEALVPLALLPLFSRWTLLALPGLAGILLASDPSIWRMGMHYALLWIPLFALGACWKLCKLVRDRSERTAQVWWIAALTLCVVALIAFDPMHPSHYLRREAFMHPIDAQHALHCVRQDSPVAMHDEWYAHEALAFPRSTVLGTHPENFDGYVVYDAQWQGSTFASALPALRTAENDGALQLVCTSGSVRVLRPAVTSRAEQ